MWTRLRRRTFAPRRPAVLPEQVGLVLVTAATILGGLAIVVWGLVGHWKHGLLAPPGSANLESEFVD